MNSASSDRSARRCEHTSAERRCRPATPAEEHRVARLGRRCAAALPHAGRHQLAGPLLLFVLTAALLLSMSCAAHANAAGAADSPAAGAADPSSQTWLSMPAPAAGSALDTMARTAASLDGSALSARADASATKTAGVRKTGATATRTRATKLYKAAVKARKARAFTRSYRLFRHARQLYLSLGDARRARICLTGMQDLFLISNTYPYTRSQMAAILAETYPNVSAKQRRAWLDSTSSESMVYDGARHYFSELAINLAYRDYDLYHTLPDHMAGNRKAYALLAPYMDAAKHAQPWQPYAEPTSYAFTQTLDVPRAELPDSGRLNIWLPTPLEGGPQTDVRISNVTDVPWLNLPPTINGDISLLYLGVPLTRLSGDLQFSFDVSFKHASQYFKVDPTRVGSYDRSSALFRTYTKSRGNTTITRSIRRTAKRVVGRETNPYLAARRLYRFVLRNVKYSFMPHFALWPRGIPESVYVHRHRYGDCGAQSMYFASLCRSVGIPCRTTGGFQLFTGKPAGHFWAEFYLPNYGWVPVDPTAATLIDYLPEISAADKKAFHDFFFGSQDDLRLVVQKDVDEPLAPPGKGRIALPLAIQFPAALCDTMTAVPSLVLMQYWTYE